jgi:hypothetical protein
MGGLHGFNEILTAANHLDVGWYQKIASTGYSIEPEILDGQSTVFFPLFPLLASPFIHLFSLSSLSALFIVQKLALAVMAYLAFKWSAAAGLSPKESTLSLFLHPAWIFLVIPYSESLYLCCLFALFLAWQSENKLAFFASAFFLGLCRPTGLFLLPATGLTLLYYTFEACTRFKDARSLNQAAHISTTKPTWREAIFHACINDATFKQRFTLLCTGVAASLIALGTVALVMHVSVGDWFAFYRYRSLWKEEPSVRYFLTALNLDFGSQTPRILATWAALWGTALLLRTGRIFEGSLCAVSILLPVYQGKLGDIIRYTLGAAPAWMVLSEHLKSRPTIRLAFIAAGCAYGVVLCSRWLSRGWVG